MAEITGETSENKKYFTKSGQNAMPDGSSYCVFEIDTGLAFFNEARAIYKADKDGKMTTRQLSD